MVYAIRARDSSESDTEIMVVVVDSPRWIRRQVESASVEQEDERVVGEELQD